MPTLTGSVWVATKKVAEQHKKKLKKAGWKVRIIKRPSVGYLVSYSK